MDTDSSTFLMDSRDGKIYRVTKMRDGHCWMTSNLALDGGRTLTPSDSDVVTNRTLPNNVTLTEAIWSDTSAQIYSGHAKASDAYESEYGNYYNWNAATATVGVGESSTVYESICPKGWRLPDDTSYSDLFSQYTFESPTTIQQYPFSMPLSGLVDTNADEVANIGYTAQFHTRTSTTNNGLGWQAYLHHTTNNPTVTSLAKGYIVSLRCVFGESSENIMQNFTTTMCSNLAESTATADNRKVLQDSRDGKKYFISHLADGNCWMTSNLALDGGRTLTPADSNVSNNVILPLNINEGASSSADVIQIYSEGAENVDSYGSLFGNLYNYLAATGGSSYVENTNMQYSICPKRWYLPKNTGTLSYNNLLSAYSLPTSNTINATAVANIQKAPFYMPLASLTGNIATRFMPGVGTYWSSTTVSRWPYYLAFSANSGEFRPQDNQSATWQGLSVRCVLGN